MADPAAAPARSNGALKWVLAAIAVLIVVGLAVWAGTKGQVATIRPADLAYLRHNKERPGVITTASGLQYEVLKQGDGAKPDATDTVLAHYEGKLLDGTVFDSSYQRGQPAAFPLDHVIPGWTEGVQLMKTGAKYRFTIPPVLGYGSAGAPPVIPPNSVLVFDVELLAIKPK